MVQHGLRLFRLLPAAAPARPQSQDSECHRGHLCQRSIPHPSGGQPPDTCVRGSQGRHGALPRLGSGRLQEGRAQGCQAQPAMEKDTLHLRPVPDNLRDDSARRKLQRGVHRGHHVPRDTARRRQLQGSAVAVHGRHIDNRRLLRDIQGFRRGLHGAHRHRNLQSQRTGLGGDVSRFQAGHGRISETSAMWFPTSPKTTCTVS